MCDDNVTMLVPSALLTEPSYPVASRPAPQAR
jgi:hypothetical protein